MRRSAALVFALLLLSLGPSFVLAQTPPSNVTVFSIKLEEKGAADGESYEKIVEAAYAPCSIWNNGQMGMGTPAILLAQRGSVAAMKPGEVLQLYIIRKTGSGKDSGGTSGSVRTIGDGLFSWTVVRGNKTDTYDNSKEASTNRAMGPSANAVAEIERTDDGAVLWISLPFVEIEGYGDFFGMFEGNNVPEALRETLTFKFTNAELKNWASLQKVNDRSLPGPEGGTLKMKVSFSGR